MMSWDCFVHGQGLDGVWLLTALAKNETEHPVSFGEAGRLLVIALSGNGCMQAIIRSTRTGCFGSRGAIFSR